MAAKQDTEISIEPEPKRMRVVFNGETIADSAQALVLKETGHADVHYFPRADVRMGFLRPADHHTHCPYKGNAAYWSIEVGGEAVENAAWSYEEPFHEVSAIKGCLSFYPNRVNILGV